MLARVRADRAAVIDPYIQKMSAQDQEALAAAVGALRRLVDDISAG